MRIAHPSPEGFWEFCALRTDAWRAKESGAAPPYSADPVIKTRHFCNVYREVDKGTLYFRQHADRSRRFDDRLGQVVFQSIAYRLINWRATFSECPIGALPRPDTMPQWFKYLERRAELGIKTFTDKHQVHGLGRYRTSVGAILRERDRDKFVDDILMAKDMPAVFKVLTGIPFVGAFFGWQVMCDLLEARVLAQADRDDWAKLGSGAVMGAKGNGRGGEWVGVAHGRGYEYLLDLRPLEIARWLRNTQDEIIRNAGVILVPPMDCPGPMSLKNVEHGLCEYSRYVLARAYGWQGLATKALARAAA